MLLTGAGAATCEPMSVDGSGRYLLLPLGAFDAAW